MLSHAYIPLLLLLCNSTHFFSPTWQLSHRNVTPPSHYLLTYYLTMCTSDSNRVHDKKCVHWGEVCCHLPCLLLLHENVWDGLLGEQYYLLLLLLLLSILHLRAASHPPVLYSSWCCFTLSTSREFWEYVLVCSTCYLSMWSLIWWVTEGRDTD